MLFAPVLSAAQAIGFRIQDLSIRRLQEHGISARGVFAVHRWVLPIALAWSLVFVRLEHLRMLRDDPWLLAQFVFIGAIWNIQSFTAVVLLNTTSSISLMSVLERLLYLPTLLVMGVVVNRDIPNAYSLVAIACLVVAMLIQPTQHETNLRARFGIPVIAVVGLAVTLTFFNALNNAVARAVLATFPPAPFLGIFSVLCACFTVLITLFLRRPASDAAPLRRNRALVFAIPVLWFAASIPETWAYASLPIYTVVAIGAVTFLLDLGSDMRHRRIRLDARTSAFALLTFAGIAAAALSA